MKPMIHINRKQINMKEHVNGKRSRWHQANASFLMQRRTVMNKKLSKHILPEYIPEIKKIDLLTYLQRYEPNSIIKKKDYYESITKKGLLIYKDRWVWNEENLNGNSAIQYLVFVENFHFYDALYLLFRCYEKELKNGKKIYK